MGAKRFIAEQQTYYSAVIRRRAQRCDMRSSGAPWSAAMRRMEQRSFIWGGRSCAERRPATWGNSGYTEQRPAAATTTTAAIIIIIIILARFRELA